jgi:hypothetical protein
MHTIHFETKCGRLLAHLGAASTFCESPPRGRAAADIATLRGRDGVTGTLMRLSRVRQSTHRIGYAETWAAANAPACEQDCRLVQTVLQSATGACASWTRRCNCVSSRAARRAALELQIHSFESTHCSQVNTPVYRPTRRDSGFAGGESPPEPHADALCRARQLL